MATLAQAGDMGAGPLRSGNVDALIDEPRITRLQLRMFLICALALFCEGYDLQALALAVPEIAGQLGVSPERFSLALSASLLGMAIGGAAFGPLGDRIGRKPMLVIAMVLTGGSTLAALLHISATWMTVCRLATGIGLGITTVNTAAIMSDYAPAKWRFLLMTVMNCAVPGGAFIAAMVAPAVLAQVGWHGIFWVGGLLPIAVAAVVWLGLPESLKWLVATRPGDRRIAVILRQMAPGLAPERLFLTQREQHTRQSILGLLAPQRRALTLVAWLGTMSGAFCLYLMMSWLPTVLREAQWSTADALRGTAAVQLGGIVGGLAIALAIDRQKLVPALLAGYGCSALALLAIGLLPGTVFAWQVLLLLAGAGTAGIQGIWMSIAVALYPLELRATSAGWMAAISRVGAVSAPLAGGLALSADMQPKNILL
ncbi:MAG TPA: MFS transporter, partial [Croceibacterium sp.]|nr:MFS transporter [Croceibacterium sp.]